MWSAFLELNKKIDQFRAIKEFLRVLKEGGFAFIEMGVPIKKTKGKIISENDKDELIIKKNFTIGKMGNVESPAMYRHNKKTFRELFKKAKIGKYEINISDFGGRDRLLVRFWK